MFWKRHNSGKSAPSCGQMGCVERFFFFFVKFGEMKRTNSAQIAARCKGVMKGNQVKAFCLDKAGEE